MPTSSKAATLGAEEPVEIPATAAEPDMPAHPGWDGPTYYGRSQLKASPFDPWVVGGYIFLAGLSGAAMMLSAIVDTIRPGPWRTTVRNGRYLSMLAPVLGAPLLIYDLHTPQRFANMLRIAKHTSPMSIGTWILMSFSASAGVSVGGEVLSGWLPGMRRVARIGQVPAALTGAGLASYTATLLAATSTPFWAASPRGLATRFSCSSIATGAAALSLLEPDAGRRRQLDSLVAVALGAELVAGAISDRTYDRTGVADARKSVWGKVERIGVTAFGAVVPIGLILAGRFTSQRTTRQLGAIAGLCTLSGSLLLRVSTIGIGDESAARPEISFRFSQPENLPDKAQGRSIRAKLRALAGARNTR
jgi:protein NrfD